MGCMEAESLEGELGADTLQHLEEVEPVEGFHLPTAQGDLQDANPVGDSRSWGAFSSLQGDVASSHQGEEVSSRLGEGVPSLLVDATNHRDDHPSLAVGVLLVPSRVAQALLHPIHGEAVDPILLAGVDPTHLAAGDLLVPILLGELVAIHLEAEGPNHQVEVAPIPRVAAGLLEAGVPIHLEVEGPTPVGPCQKVGRPHLEVPWRADSVLVPSCQRRRCEQQG